MLNVAALILWVQGGGGGGGGGRWRRRKEEEEEEEKDIYWPSTQRIPDHKAAWVAPHLMLLFGPFMISYVYR